MPPNAWYESQTKSESSREHRTDRSGGPLGMYLRSIGRPRPPDHAAVLDRMRELRRLEAYAESTDSADEAARARRGARVLEHEVLRGHLRLVVSVASRWRHSAVPLLDLIQEGNLGLMRAVQLFDPERDVRFSTYAVWWIRHAVLRAIESQSRTVRLPSRVCEGLTRRRAAMRALRAALAREPEPDELAGTLGISPAALGRLERADLAGQVVTHPEPDGEVSLVERLPDPGEPSPDAGVVRRWSERAVRRVLSVLIPRDRRVVELRLGLGASEPLSQREVGRRLGLSGERVRQIEKAALATLRSRGRSPGQSPC